MSEASKARETVGKVRRVAEQVVANIVENNVELLGNVVGTQDEILQNDQALPGLLSVLSTCDDVLNRLDRGGPISGGQRPTQARAELAGVQMVQPQLNRLLKWMNGYHMQKVVASKATFADLIKVTKKVLVLSNNVRRTFAESSQFASTTLQDCIPSQVRLVRPHRLRVSRFEDSAEIANAMVFPWMQQTPESWRDEGVLTNPRTSEDRLLRSLLVRDSSDVIVVSETEACPTIVRNFDPFFRLIGCRAFLTQSGEVGPQNRPFQSCTDVVHRPVELALSGNPDITICSVAQDGSVKSEVAMMEIKTISKILHTDPTIQSVVCCFKQMFVTGRPALSCVTDTDCSRTLVCVGDSERFPDLDAWVVEVEQAVDQVNQFTGLPAVNELDQMRQYIQQLQLPPTLLSSSSTSSPPSMLTPETSSTLPESEVIETMSSLSLSSLPLSPLLSPSIPTTLEGKFQRYRTATTILQTPPFRVRVLSVSTNTVAFLMMVKFINFMETVGEAAPEWLREARTKISQVTKRGSEGSVGGASVGGAGVGGDSVVGGGDGAGRRGGSGSQDVPDDSDDSTGDHNNDVNDVDAGPIVVLLEKLLSEFPCLDHHHHHHEGDHCMDEDAPGVDSLREACDTLTALCEQVSVF